MRSALRLVRLLVGLATAAAVCIVLSFTVLAETPFGIAVQTLVGQAPSTDAENAALDSSGIKEQVDSVLRSNIEAISEATGLSVTQVRAMVNELNIPSWTVAELPSDASGASDTTFVFEGVSATVTTYDDPSYVTVGAAGQSLTLSVPESARQYLSYLSLLE